MARQPYVEDVSVARAYRRSAQIDREEADCLDLDDPRYQTCLDSAAEFERLAEYHDRLVTGLRRLLTGLGDSQDTAPTSSG